MKKLTVFTALLMAFILLFGSITAAAEAETAEAETEAAEAAEEAAEEDAEEAPEEDAEEAPEAEVVSDVTYEFEGLGFCIPEDWEVSDPEEGYCEIRFGDQGSYIGIEAFAVDDDSHEGEIEIMLSLLETLDAASFDTFEYELNGLDCSLYALINVKAQEDGEQLNDRQNLFLLEYEGDEVKGFVMAELYNDDLDTYKNDLLSFFTSFGVVTEETEEEDVEDTDSEAEEEAAEEDAEAEAEEEAAEEDAEAEVEEEAAEEDAEAEVEEVIEEAEAEAEEVIEEAEAEDAEAEDAEAEDAEEAGSISWVEKSVNGVTFRIPDYWEGEETDTSAAYEVNGLGSMEIQSIGLDELGAQGITDGEMFFAMFAEEIESTMEALGGSTVRTYAPFTINGIDMQLYYTTMDLEDYGTLGYYWTIFYGSGKAGMAAFFYMPELGELMDAVPEEPDLVKSEFLGFLTSLRIEETVEETEE